MSNLEENKQLARAFFDAMQYFDGEALSKILDPSIRFNVPNIGCLGGVHTLADVPMIAEVVGGSLKDGMRFDILELTAEGDRVACRAQGTAELKDGRQYNNKYHFLLRIRDGKIIETHEYMDSLLLEDRFAETAERLKQQQAAKANV